MDINETKLRIKSIELSNDVIITVCDKDGIRETTTNLEKLASVLLLHKAANDTVKINFNKAVIYQDDVSRKSVLAEIKVKDKKSNLCIRIKEEKLHRINDIVKILETILDCSNDKGIDINIIRSSNSSRIDLDIKSKKDIGIYVNDYLDTLIIRGINISLVAVIARHIIIECEERLFCGNINCERLDIRLKKHTENSLITGVSVRRVAIDCYDSNDAIRMCNGVIGINPKIESLRARADSLGKENNEITDARVENILQAVVQRNTQFIINKCIMRKIGNIEGIVIVDEKDLIKSRQRASKLGTKAHIIGISED